MPCSNLQHIQTVVIVLLFQQDLIDDLKYELTGKFERLIVSLMRTPAHHDAKEIHDALKVRHLPHNTSLYHNLLSSNDAKTSSYLTWCSVSRELEQTRNALLKSWRRETTNRCMR